jgi:hypothetical protein
MADQRHTLESIARHFIRAAAPLIDAGTSLANFQRLMGRLGFAATTIPAPFATLALNTRNAQLKVDGFPPGAPLADILALLNEAKGVFDSIQGLAAGPVPDGVDPAAYAAEIGDGLFSLLLTEYVAADFSASFNLLKMVGIIKVDPVLGTSTRPGFMRQSFQWPEFAKLVSDPSGFPARVFHWGTPQFDPRLVVDQLAEFLAGLNFPVALRPPEEEVLRGYMGLSAERIFPGPPSLHMPFIYARLAGNMLEAAFDIHALGPQAGKLPGIVIEPRIPLDFPVELQLHPKVKLRLRAGTNAGSLFGIVIRPNEVSLRYPLAPGTPPPSVGIGVGFDFNPGTPIVLFGDPKASRLEFGGASIDLSADFSNGAWSVGLAPDLKGLKVVIDAGEGDSFIRSIVGGKSSIDLPLGIEWTQANGIRFKGSAAFEVALHPHLHLGPIAVDDVTVKLAVPAEPPSRVQLEIGASIAGELGPLQFTVQGIGMRSEMTFAEGNAGPFGITLGFKPPNGVGLELDTGGFKGGGFLRLDPDKGEYEGGLELTFAGTISIRAVGILTTRMPDGSEGFSLLIIIVSEFPPIQLSFGFTLIGVGGLLGLNRTVLLDELQVGVRDGSLNSILFPTDVVANATRIIGDLKRIFPPQDGHFLIGPMAKLGWGTPTLISLSLGLILDIPRPMFAVLGLLRMALPAEELAILNLQVSFAGSVDFEKGQLQFDASLFDSRVLTFTLTGDMAVRVYWKDNANFLLSVGGFHPSYTPPPMNLGELARVGIVLFQGNPHISAQAYFAVTSNSVQFGARVEAYYGIELFNVYGFLGLDVLINFNPFHFVAEITAELGVRTGDTVLFAIQLQLLLEGPTPWHARGTGSFRIGFIVKITVSAGFEVTFGDARETRLPPVDVLAEMVKALVNLGNWKPRLPSGSNQHVTLRELPDPTTVLVLHPFGALEITQKLVPLHIAIQRFGSRAPDAGSVFTLADVKLGAEDAGVSNTKEQFAPAQFFDMSDAEKLSRPSFADYDAGIVIGGDLAPRTDLMRMRDVVYEVIYLPEHHPVSLFFALAVELAASVAQTSAVAQSSVSQAQRSVSVLEERVSWTAESFAVVSSDDLTLHASHLVFDNATAADQAVQNLVAASPELFGAIQVLAAAGIAKAA